MAGQPKPIETIDGANRDRPTETVCRVCCRTLEHLDTACERPQCPLRPRIAA